MKNRDLAFKGFVQDVKDCLATKWDIDDAARQLELTTAKKH